MAQFSILRHVVVATSRDGHRKSFSKFPSAIIELMERPPWTRSCASSYNNSFYALHIPKTAGTSFVQACQTWLPFRSCREYPYHPGTAGGSRSSPARLTSTEGCLSHASQHGCMLALALVREPRAHVLSQWAHCKGSRYAPGWARARMPPFAEWVRYYVDWERNRTRSIDVQPSVLANFTIKTTLNEPFSCPYTPVNMQTQRLTCLKPGVIPAPAEWEGLASLSSTYLGRHVYHVGVAERFVASLCVLATKMLGHVPSSCLCARDPDVGPGNVSAASAKVAHTNHGVRHHNVDEYPEQVLEMVDSITQADQQVYAAARVILDEEIRRIEALHGVRTECWK